MERLFFERMCAGTGDGGEFCKAGVGGGRKGLRMEWRGGPALSDVARRPPFDEKKIRVYRETDNSIFAAKTRRNNFVVYM